MRLHHALIGFVLLPACIGEPFTVAADSVAGDAGALGPEDLVDGAGDDGAREDLVDGGRLVDDGGVLEDVHVDATDADAPADVQQPPQVCTSVATCPACAVMQYACCTSARVCGCEFSTFGPCR